MALTKSNAGSQKPEKELSIEQKNAIDLLVQGRTDQEVADEVGVARETVCRWRNDDPYFQAELNRRRKEIWGAAHDRLRALVSKAVDTLEGALEEGDVKAAVEVLKAVKLYGEVDAPQGSEDAEQVLWKQAEAWARKEHAKRPKSVFDVDMINDEAEITEMTKERMEELKEAHGEYESL